MLAAKEVLNGDGDGSSSGGDGGGGGGPVYRSLAPRKVLLTESLGESVGQECVGSYRVGRVSEFATSRKNGWRIASDAALDE